MRTGRHEDRARFLERRLAWFGLWAFGAMFLGLVIRLTLDFALGNGLRLRDIGGHVLASLALLFLYAVLRADRGLSTRALAVIDVIVMNGVALGLAVMASNLPLNAHPTLVMLLALTFVFTMRATYVPSRTRQTVLVHATATAWLMGSAWATAWRRVDAGLVEAAPGLRSELISAAVWWAFNSAAAAAATSVIYGLRREVREASQLGQYTLIEKVGAGGMGEVYRASHAMLRRPTAVKLLPPQKTGDRATARFEREVQRTASIAHPNVVTVFDYGRTPDGVFYYAMELLDGLDLSELVVRYGPLSPARAVHVLVQVCEGLAAAHAVGLIHRDVKPANVFLLRGGRTADLAKLVDFGLVLDQAEASGDPSGDDIVIGTPACMAPEAVSSPESVDARSDLYAVGAVGYFLLAGRYPFEAKNLVDVVAAHLHEEPPPIERSDLPEALDEVIRRCLAKDPAHRPASAVELRGWLESLEDVRPWLHEEAEAWWQQEARAEPLVAVDGEPRSPTLSIELEGRL